MNKRALVSLVAGVLLAAVSSAVAETVQISALQVDNIVQTEGRPAVNKSAGGNALKIAGEKYDNGLGLAAPSRIVIKLNGGSDHFTAVVGVDDEVAGKEGGTVSFAAILDGVQVFPAQPGGAAGRGGAAAGRGRGGVPTTNVGGAQKIDVDLKGARVLVLETGAGTDGTTNDHGDWADAKIEYSGLKPAIVQPSKDAPVILTPKAADTPRINSAKVIGVRPGNPLLFTVVATGVRPMKFAAEGLPAGLALDPATGNITGKVAARGEYAVKVHATNSLGTADGALKIVVGDQINLTPQLGWNSWNCFGSSVTDEKIRAAADAMVNSGLVNHGWVYVNIDDFWEKNAQRGRQDAAFGGPARAEDGTILTNGHFPDMKALADYVHSKGMKIGLYSSPGTQTCGGCTGSYDHEEQDAKLWAAWGYDYLKYDICFQYANQPKAAGKNPNSSPEYAQIPYRVMGDILKKLDRDIVYSLCQYGQQNVGSWGASVGGNSWRTTGDISGNWRSVTSIFDQQVGREVFAGPGHWNDPDMLVVGRTAIGSGNNPTQGLSANEMTTHMSAWIILNSPMLIGCDMTKMDAFTQSLLENDEVIAVSQDPLGKQATRIIPPTAPFGQRQEPAGIFQVWVKDMEDGSKVVGLFSRNEIDDTFGVKWSDLKISGKQVVRDLWRQKDIGTFDSAFETVVPRHGVMLLKVTPAK